MNLLKNNDGKINSVINRRKEAKARGIAKESKSRNPLGIIAGI